MLKNWHMLFLKFHLKVVENDDQTLLELDFRHFFRRKWKYFQRYLWNQIEISQNHMSFFDKVIIESLRPWVISADFPFVRN